jgi:hypothetical protein
MVEYVVKLIDTHTHTRSFSQGITKEEEGTIEGRAQVTRRRGRRRKQILDYFKKTIGYWKLKNEAIDRILWRIRLEG